MSCALRVRHPAVALLWELGLHAAAGEAVLGSAVRPQPHGGGYRRQGVDELGVGVGARREGLVELDVHNGLGGLEHHAGALAADDPQEHRAVLCALRLRSFQFHDCLMAY